MLTRRFVIAAAAATAAAHALPAGLAATPAATTATPAAPLLPAWVVGTPGALDWGIVRATTMKEAIAIRVEEHTGLTACACEPGESGECEYCWSSFDALRVPRMDAIERPTDADWLRAGLGHRCSRCGYQAFPYDVGYPVGDEAVCDDCMTLADWDIVDPERAAELRAGRAE